MNTTILTKTKDLIGREKTPSFLKELDLYEIEGDGTLIGVTGSLGRGFKIEGKDLLLQSNQEIEDFEKRMRRFLNSLPEGIVIHFLVRSRTGDEKTLAEYRKFIKCEDLLAQEFVKAKLDAYQHHPLFKREIYVFVIIPHSSKRPRSSYFPDLQVAFGKKSHELARGEYQTLKETLTTISTEVEEGLRELGFEIKPLTEFENLKYLYELLNPGYSEVVPYEEYCSSLENTEDPSSLRSKLFLSAPLLDYEFFQLNEYFHRTLNLVRLPKSTSLKSMKSFEKELGGDYFLSVTLEIPDQEKEKALIQRERNFAISKNFLSRSKDNEALAKAGETDEFLNEIANTQDKLFYISIAVMIKDRDKEQSRLRSDEALHAFRCLGDSHGLRDHMNHDRLFLSFLPLQGSENPLAYLVRSEVVTHLIPLQASWKGTREIGLLLKTYSNEPLRLDLFDSKLPAKHSVAVGTSGSGKSFFANHLLLHFLIESPDHEVIVIDLGGSYKKLASVLEGAYLEVECSEDYALNPFPAKEVLFPEKGEADANFVQFLKELLEQMIDPARIWSSNEKMILEEAIREAYKNLSKEDSPLLGDIEKSLRNFQSGDEEDKRKAYLFSKELTLFTQGEYGKILNRPGRFDINSRFTVFDLRKISSYPELQEILLLIIPFSLKRKFENLNRKKLLVLDECWQLLKKAKGREIVELFYRTARKFNGAVLSISQNPEDFLESEIAAVMINNSPVKYILKLKQGHKKLSLFGLNENEIQAVTELEVKPGQYSEVFIKFDKDSVMAKLKPSPLEYWVSTTDPIDCEEERRLKEEHPDFSSIQIVEELSQRFPGGVQKMKEAA